MDTNFRLSRNDYIVYLNDSSMDNYLKVIGNMASTTHNITATNARYMRLNATAPEQGSDAACINEVEVYGK